MSRSSQWQDHDAPQPFSLSKALLDLVSTQTGYPWRVLLHIHTSSHMDNICLLCGVGQSSLIESLSQLCVMFSQLIFRILSGKFIVDWARHFLSFSPTLTTEVSPQTGGLVRNSTGEECFSKANPTEKKTPPLSVVGFLSTFGLISHIECYYLWSRCVINKAGYSRATDVITAGCWEIKNTFSSSLYFQL